MTLARGKKVYSVDAPMCMGIGYVWSELELSEAINDRVAAVLFDDEGRHDVEELLSGIIETEFEEKSLRRILDNPRRIEKWRIGEAIAETWLTAHRNCFFPWSNSRDERKRNSSLPGADLVGLHSDDRGECLALGEVKTSSQESYPTSVMYGREGLRQQILSLRDKVDLRNGLFEYLCFRARNETWKLRFQQAAKRYMSDSSDVILFGYLVRDVSQDKKDLESSVFILSENCPNEMVIQFIALYIPNDSLNRIVDSIVASREGMGL